MPKNTNLEMRSTATPLYPGAFFPESGDSRPVPYMAEPRYIANLFRDTRRWFCLEVISTQFKRWTDDNDTIEWRPVSGFPTSKRRIYVGSFWTLEQLELLLGDNRILISNARSYGGLIRTRLGNWQPKMDSDTVLADQESW